MTREGYINLRLVLYTVKKPNWTVYSTVDTFNGG